MGGIGGGLSFFTKEFTIPDHVAKFVIVVKYKERDVKVQNYDKHTFKLCFVTLLLSWLKEISQVPAIVFKIIVINFFFNSLNSCTLCTSLQIFYIVNHNI